jgi:hypothetical protein
LDFKLDVAVLYTAVKLGVAVNVVDGSHVVGDKRKDFFTGLLRIKPHLQNQ